MEHHCKTCSCHTAIYECNTCHYKTHDIGCFEFNKIKMLNKDKKITIQTIYSCHECISLQKKEIKLKIEASKKKYVTLRKEFDEEYKKEDWVKKGVFIPNVFNRLIEKYNLRNNMHIKKYGETKFNKISLFNFYISEYQ